MLPLAITVAVGPVLFLLLSVAMRRPSAQKPYQGLGDRQLVDASVNAHMMRRFFAVLALLGPQPLILAGAFLPGLDASARTLLYCLGMLTMYAATAGFFVVFEIVRITRTEMEFRKFKVEKARIEQAAPADRVGST